LTLVPGLALDVVLARWGEPDSVDTTVCETRENRPFDCREVVYGGCTLVFDRASAGEPLNFWQCR
jgi:hypothetical protein